MAEMTAKQTERCRVLWNAMHFSIERWHESITVHPKSVFVGYVDITYGAKDEIVPGLLTKIRGLEVKMIGDKPHLGFPTELGSDGEYYPKIFPKSRELREVLTLRVFQNEDIAASIIKAGEMPAAGDEPVSEASTSSDDADPDNPFNEEEQAA